ncbi:MAG: hypothetical protein JWR50_143 [Mucilaginibacter sp.]|nr:hypothetical protein [Mucilaginibacter sp.]
MRKYLILIILLVITLTSRADTISNIIAPLKAVLLQKAYFDRKKETVIDNYKIDLYKCGPTNYERRYLLCRSLFKEYKVYKFDSAFVYAQKLVNLAQRLNSPYKKVESQLNMAMVLESTGLFIETYESIAKINSSTLEAPLKLPYYELLFHCENDLTKYNRGTLYEDIHSRNADRYLDSAIRYAAPNSFEQHIHLAEKRDTPGRPPGVTHYWYLYKNFPLTTHQRAIVATGLSFSYSGQDKIKLLVTGAINDIRASVKETEAIFLLGRELAEMGRLDDAYEFVQAATNDAEFYNARLRKVEFSGELSMISEKRINQVESDKANFIIYLIAIVGVSVIIFLIAFIIFFQLKRLKLKEVIINEKNTILERTNERLYSDSRIKEEYIGYFFNVFSSYILKMEKLKIGLERRIKTGKYEDALAITYNIDIKKERESLFETFDQTFLRLFPNFVSAFNSLLHEEDQLHPKDGELLSAHLRIFALMRLGIVNNKIVAQILEYSESTVYTYKNRIKNKALVQGAAFDDAVMNIKIGL